MAEAAAIIAIMALDQSESGQKTFRRYAVSIWALFATMLVVMVCSLVRLD